MTSEIKAALRLKRLMSALDISNADRHGKRVGKIAHVDASRTHLNRHWSYQAGALVQVEAAPDLAPALERRREDRGAVRRANTPTLATEVMFITSRSAFLDASGQIDNDRAYQWADQMLAAFEERFPGMTAAARLDLDERSPHLSIFAVPIYLKPGNKPRADVSEDARARRKPRAPKATVSHKQVFGGIEEMRDLQRWVQGLNADFLAPLGLNLTASTDRRESGANHIHPDDFRRIMGDVNKIKAGIEAGALQEAADLIQNAAAQVEQMMADAQTAAQEVAAQIKAEAEADRDAARTAAAEARQAAENARDEARQLLDVVKVAQPLAPLHAAYEALLDGSSLTPQQTLAAQLAADQDCKWIDREVFTPRENGFDRADRDAAVWATHPEVAAEIRARRPDPMVLDLMAPASAKISFRARFINRMSGLRDLVMNAVKTVIRRRAASVQQDAQARMADPDFRASADLGRRLFNDTWGDLRRETDRGDMIGRSASKKAEADWREWQNLDSRAHDPARAAQADLWAEATDHARAASVVAARIERGPKMVAQWLQIPRSLRETFVSALEAAAKLETALARRTHPDPEKRAADTPSASAEGPTTRKDGPSR